MTPDGWRETSLGEIARVEIGRTPARKEKSYWDPEKTTNNRWATIRDVKSKFVGETAEHISEIGVRHSRAQRIPTGTLLMSFKLTLGRAAITSYPMYTNEALAAFYHNNGASTEYLYYLLPNLALEESSDRAVKGRTLNKGKLRALRLMLPPLSEQRKIAAILSSVDDAIEKTQAVIDQIQVVKRGLLQALFVRGIPGRHTQFKQSEIGDIPTEWTVVQLEELCSHVVDCLHRTPPYTDVGYPAIRTSDLLAGRLLLDKAKRVSRNTYLEQISRLEPTVGDVLYSREGTFGLAASVPPDVELCISQRMMHFRARPSIDPGFLMWLLNSPTVYRQAVNSVGGSTVGHVNIRSIRRFLVPLPEREEQTQLAAVLNSASQVEVTSERSLSGHQRAKTALMSVLLTGELRVTPDPEPE